MYYGSWKINDTPTFVINTHNPTNGMAQNADATPSYHVYEDETATPLLTGTMALLNNPNTLGFYSEQISLTAANGFEKGKSYNIYIRAVVANVTGTTSHNFQIEAEVDANTVSVPVTAGMVTGSVLGNVNGNVAGNVNGNVVGSVGSVVDGVSVDGPVLRTELGMASANLDTQLSGLDANFDSIAANVWSEPLPASYTAGLAGYILASRMPTGTVLVGDKTGFSLSSPQNFNLIGNISGTLSNVNTVVNPVTVGTNNDKTGYSLSSPQSVNIIGNISGTITNVLNVVNPVVAGIVTGSVLGNVNGSVNSVTTPVGVSTGSFINAIADQVWDEQLSSHLSAGSAGSALNGAGAAGDPWATPLPGAYGAGTAGHILASRMPTGTVIVGANNDKTGYFLSTPQAFDLIGNISGTLANVQTVLNPVGLVTGTLVANLANLDTTITSRASQTSVNTIDDFLDTEVAAIKAKTDNLPANPAAVSDIPTAIQNADALLKRDWTAVTGEAARSVLNALRFIRNKFSTTASPGSVTVYKEDDTTVAYTKSVTTDASADPIVEG